MYVYAHAHRHKYSANLPRSQYNIYVPLPWLGYTVYCIYARLRTYTIWYSMVCATNRQTCPEERPNSGGGGRSGLTSPTTYVLSSRDSVIIYIYIL